MICRKGKIYLEKTGLRAAICDDDEAVLRETKEAVQRCLERLNSRCELILFSDPCRLIEDGKMFDVILLDIEMPGLNGLEVARRLREKNRDGLIIFLTRYGEYMQQAFKTRAFRYLCRPLVQEELEEALSDAFRELSRKAGIVVESRGESRWIAIQDILYVESLGDEVLIGCPDDMVIVKRTLRSCIEWLGMDFAQCHKSFAVNLRHLRRIDESGVLLDNGRTIPVSVRKRHALAEAFHHFMRDNA